MRPVRLRSVKDREESLVPRLKFRRIVVRTGLLNFGILLSAVPLALVMGIGEALPLLLVVLGGVSLAIWTLTFAIAGLILVGEILWGQSLESRARLDYRGGVVDKWLDDPA